MAVPSYILSKSSFIRGLQCLKSLYLYKNRYFLRDRLSPEQQAIFTRGWNVGLLARELFPGGVTMPRPSAASAEKTAEFMKSGQTVIYEACFIYNEVLIAVDILLKSGNGWKAIEVKSSRMISQTFLFDAFLQYYVIHGAGVDLEDFQLLHIDPDYTREENLDLNRLFKMHSVIDPAREYREWVSTKIDEMKKAARAGKSPQVDIGPHCFDPYPCDFHDHCWKKIPSPSVFDPDSFTPDEKFDLYHRGFVRIEDIPLAELNSMQAIELKCYLDNTSHLEKPLLDEFLSAIRYPVTFLKVLHFKPAIPLFPGDKPYQAKPFAFYARQFEAPGLSKSYISFINEPGIDPEPVFGRNLIKAISGCATVLFFADELTGSFIREWAENKVVVNLSVPFVQKMWFHPAITGFSDEMSLLSRITGESSPEAVEFHSPAMAGVYYEILASDTNEGEITEAKEKINRYLLSNCKASELLLEFLTGLV